MPLMKTFSLFSQLNLIRECFLLRMRTRTKGMRENDSAFIHQQKNKKKRVCIAIKNMHIKKGCEGIPLF